MDRFRAITEYMGSSEKARQEEDGALNIISGVYTPWLAQIKRNL